MYSLSLSFYGEKKDSKTDNHRLPSFSSQKLSVVIYILQKQTSTLVDKEDDDYETDDFGKIGTKNRLPHRLPQSNWYDDLLRIPSLGNVVKFVLV